MAQKNSDDKGMKIATRNITAFFTMFMAFFSALPCGQAGDAAYHIISKNGQNGKETVKRMISRNVPSSCSSDFSWDDAGRCILTGDPSHITITGAGVLPVQANIETTETKPAKVADYDVIILSFKISGSASGSGAEAPSDNSYEREIRSIMIDGLGMTIVDAKTKVPLAGKLILSRKVEASLWSQDQTGEKLSGNLGTAWSIMP